MLDKLSQYNNGLIFFADDQYLTAIKNLKELYLDGVSSEENKDPINSTVHVVPRSLVLLITFILSPFFCVCVSKSVMYKIIIDYQCNTI